MNIMPTRGFLGIKTNHFSPKNNNNNKISAPKFANSQYMSNNSISFGESKKAEIIGGANVSRRLVSPEVLQDIGEMLESYENMLSNTKQMQKNLQDKLYGIDDMVDQFDVFTKNDVNRWLEEYNIALEDGTEGNLKAQKNSYWFVEGANADDSALRPPKQILGYDKENNRINCYIEDYTEYDDNFMPIGKENKNHIYTYPNSNSAAYCEGRTGDFDYNATPANERMLHFNLYTGLVSDYSENVKFFNDNTDETYTTASSKLIFMPNRKLSAMRYCANVEKDPDGLFAEKVIEFCEDLKGRTVPKYYYENLHSPNHTNYKETYTFKAERLEDGRWVVLEDNLPKEE